MLTNSYALLEAERAKILETSVDRKRAEKQIVKATLFLKEPALRNRNLLFHRDYNTTRRGYSILKA